MPKKLDLRNLLCQWKSKNVIKRTKNILLKNKEEGVQNIRKLTKVNLMNLLINSPLKIKKAAKRKTKARTMKNRKTSLQMMRRKKMLIKKK